ncbi:hypothetical protein GDN83_11415 [Gordonia jinghuaiqii]|uniref:Uncharacterized protein n=1 Tax=Gordonia jinghuaiqii TaxID=2758710 RepID=A0A7D7LT06_9ACTN|nr:hypothetical protein [Gordonia jinghuaiqii]MCR5978328.1 hypothetical protein [Gordonia jinghuaiqii]QMT01237.1 hypothetical protein H1R19_20715 [Gordonia jinghuaiqii]
MTDTVADSAVTPTSANAEAAVDAAVLDPAVLDRAALEAVRHKLLQRGIAECPQVVFLDLDPQTGVAVSRLDPGRGAIADTYTDPALTLTALDRDIADHLIGIARVGSPTTPEWRDELFDLISRGRGRLKDSDGTFLMGRRHIRLFRMARRDVAEAGGSLTARAEELARAAVAGTQAPAVVIADRVSVWPGLRDAVARAVQVPVIDAGPVAASPVDPAPVDPAPVDAALIDTAEIDTAEIDTAPADHTSTDAAPAEPGAVREERPVAVPVPEAVVEPGSVLTQDLPPIAAEVTDLIRAGEPAVPVASNVPPSPATAFGALASYLPAADMPIRVAPVAAHRPEAHSLSPTPNTIGTNLSGTSPGGLDSGSLGAGSLDAGSLDATVASNPALHEAYTQSGPAPMSGLFPGPHAITPHGPRRRSGAKRILVGLALMCALAIVGVATALAVGNDESPAPVAAPPAETTTASTGPEYADPAILAEARQPARRYTPPPPPPPPETSTPEARTPRQQPRQRAPRPQRGVTIPNPIPGLPPIVLP